MAEFTLSTEYSVTKEIHAPEVNFRLYLGCCYNFVVRIVSGFVATEIQQETLISVNSLLFLHSSMKRL